MVRLDGTNSCNSYALTLGADTTLPLKRNASGSSKNSGAESTSRPSSLSGTVHGCIDDATRLQIAAEPPFVNIVDPQDGHGVLDMAIRSNLCVDESSYRESHAGTS